MSSSFVYSFLLSGARLIKDASCNIKWVFKLGRDVINSRQLNTKPFPSAYKT